MYNTEFTELDTIQKVMDIPDYKRFKIRLYTIEKGKFVDEGSAYFEKNILNIDLNTFNILTYHRSFDKEKNILHFNIKDFNGVCFMAELPVKNYQYEQLESITVHRLYVKPTLELSLNFDSVSCIRAEGIPLATLSNPVFFDVN